MRLFIAINFNENINRKLQEVIEELRRQSKEGNFSRIENLHLTLAFLGELPVEKFNIIKDVMDEIETEPFKLELSRLGTFNRNRSPKAIYWFGIKPNEILEKIQENLVWSLKEKGFILDDKPFKPHITLARRCILANSFSKDSFNSNITDSSMIVNAISLMKSERINGILTYTEIYKKKIQ